MLAPIHQRQPHRPQRRYLPMSLLISALRVYNSASGQASEEGDMAQRVVLIDDLDGSEGTETIVYSVDGQKYEIDLSEKNAEKFRSTMKGYIDASRPVERRQATTLASGRSSRRQSSGGSGRDDIPQIRAWAEANGHEVSARGRIKKEVIDAYDEAHK